MDVRLRVALLSLMPDIDGKVRGAWTLGALPIIAHQARLCAEAGCETILCLAPGYGEAMIAAQRQAERQGARLRAVRTLDEIRAAITDESELVALDPATIPKAAHFEPLVARPAIAVFPARVATERGLERIDADTGWAGVLSVRGRTLRHLGDLPDEIDPVSAILRAARMAGTPTVDIPEKALADGRWQVIASEEHAEDAGKIELTRALGQDTVTASVQDRILAALLRQAGAEMLASRITGDGLGIAGAVLMTAGAWSAVAGYLTPAFVAGLFAIVAIGASRIAGRAASDLVGVLGNRVLEVGLAGVLIAGWITILAFAMAEQYDVSAALVIAGFTTVGVTLAGIRPSPMRPLMRETLAIGLLTVGMWMFDALLPWLAVLSAAALFALSGYPRSPAGITGS